MRDATGLTFGVTSFYAYDILQNVVTGKHQRYYRYEIMQNVVGFYSFFGFAADLRDAGQCQKRSLPIRIIAAETTYPTRCIRWMR